MLHYMGLGGMSGWAHHFVQAGYKVYLVDRPGHGRPPYHPDALGEIGALVTYDLLTRDTVTSARGPNKQWPGTTGDIGDPLVDQLVAAANSAPRDTQLAQDLWRKHGAELVDRIGGVILLTHSAGGPFGWLVANERPSLVKAVVSFEGATAPLVGAGGQPGTTLPNLKNMPMMYLVAESRGGTRRQADCRCAHEVRRTGGAHQSQGSRHPRQQPLRDVREQPAPGVRRHPGVDRKECLLNS